MTTETVKRGKELATLMLFERDGDTCPVCGGVMYLGAKGDDAPSIDHVWPLCMGGTNTPDNVRLVHHACNLTLNNIMQTTGSILDRDGTWLHVKWV